MKSRKLAKEKRREKRWLAEGPKVIGWQGGSTIRTVGERGTVGATRGRKKTKKPVGLGKKRNRRGATKVLNVRIQDDRATGLRNTREEKGKHATNGKREPREKRDWAKGVKPVKT